MTLVAATPVAAEHDAVSLSLGPYHARISQAADVMDTALALRREAFKRSGLSDHDTFDCLCLHATVTDTRSGRTCVAFRARVIATGGDLDTTYTGLSYDLTPLRHVRGPFIELGRVCQDEAHPDAIALRLAWGALTALVDHHAATMLIGCTSFPGADVARHTKALAYLNAHHVGPPARRPLRKSMAAIDLPHGAGGPEAIPRLLHSYLTLGGWVSDHAVIDTALNTVHVFTGLAVSDIPAPRKRRLRALAAAARLPA